MRDRFYSDSRRGPKQNYTKQVSCYVIQSRRLDKQMFLTLLRALAFFPKFFADITARFLKVVHSAKKGKSTFRKLKLQATQFR